MYYYVIVRMEERAGSRPPPVWTGRGTEDNMFEADAFFQAIASDQEGAMAMIPTQVPRSGAPLPQAQAFVNSSEWDSAAVFCIKYLSDGVCTGAIGIGQDRFCGASPTIPPAY